MVLSLAEGPPQAPRTPWCSGWPRLLNKHQTFYGAWCGRRSSTRTKNPIVLSVAEGPQPAPSTLWFFCVAEPPSGTPGVSEGLRRLWRFPGPPGAIPGGGPGRVRRRCPVHLFQVFPGPPGREPDESQTAVQKLSGRSGGPVFRAPVGYGGFRGPPGALLGGGPARVRRRCPGHLFQVSPGPPGQNPMKAKRPYKGYLGIRRPVFRALVGCGGFGALRGPSPGRGRPVYAGGARNTFSSLPGAPRGRTQ